MKVKLFCLFSFFLFSFTMCNPLLIAAQKETPDFTDLIQSLSKQLQNLEKEEKKEKATLKLKRCEIELKWVFKADTEGRLKAFVVTGDGGNSKEEINSFKTTWYPAGNNNATEPEKIEIENEKLIENINKLEGELSNLKYSVYNAMEQVYNKFQFLYTTHNLRLKSPSYLQSKYMEINKSLTESYKVGSSDARTSPELRKFAEELGIKIGYLSPKIFKAAAAGNVAFFRALPAEEINMQNEKGETPLMIASANGHLDIVKELYHMGADIYVKRKDGKTALELAESNGHSKIAEYLFSMMLLRAKELKNSGALTNKIIEKLYHNIKREQPKRKTVLDE